MRHLFQYQEWVQIESAPRISFAGRSQPEKMKLEKIKPESFYSRRTELAPPPTGHQAKWQGSLDQRPV